MTVPVLSFRYTIAHSVVVAFGLAVVLGVLDGGLGSSDSGQGAGQGAGTSHFALGARFFLAMTLLLFGAWFIKAFVTADLHECTRDTVHDMYRFAYVFMLVGLAMLVMPFTSMHNTGSLPDSGPIRIINGCQGSGFKARTAAAPAASAAASVWAQSPVPDCGVAEPGQTYPLLVAVGGVVGVEAPASAPSGAAPQAGKRTHAVSGGVVVPLYVIVLGFIGGAICLARKVPEYQKRTEPGFAGTTKELPLQPYEAREFVVFQVLQLVASPFIAIVTFYAFEPKTIALATVQAFFAGFSSEWVLLRIRAVVDGPGQVPTEANSQLRGDLTVEVDEPDPARPAPTAPPAPVRPVAGALVKLSHSAGGAAFASGATNASGTYTFKSIELGGVWIEVVHSRNPSKVAQVSHKVLAGRNPVPVHL